MAFSLDKLASYLEELPILDKVFKEDGYSDAQIKLLKRKGIFPYEYISSLEKLENTSLPTQADFYSRLGDSNVSEDDYKHAQNVWETFKIKDLGDYADLYLKTDVILLTQVFENFKDTCHAAYKIDPAHYYTLAHFAFDGMLYFTRIRLELLTDIEKLNMIESGIRGGVSQCCNRYAAANNPYMKRYDPSKENTYLMYFDVNNLYGYAMAQYLPYSQFEWAEDLSETNFFNVPDDSEIGYILEVDLEYPENLHDDHKDLPLCPEHMCPPGSKQKKLMTTLYDKEHYVIHYRSLKQALALGVKLKKIHKALRFKQKPWLKDFIDFNTEKRKNAKNDFDKQNYKLINNANFGKTIENERKRVDVKLLSKWDGKGGVESYIARPNFHSRSIFDENLIAVQMSRTQITIRKPIYVGLSILDISKTVVYRFHYEYMWKRFKDKGKVLYTDTDSLVYFIKDIDVYEVMKKDLLQEFDTSDYAKDNPFNMPRENCKKLGLMKDELNGNIMLEFVGLRAKLYSMRIEDKEAIKKSKGVKKYVVEKTITFDDYLRCLFDNSSLSREQCTIRSRLHILRSEKETKIALSPHDDKRYLIPGQTDTLPWGHYRVVEDQILQAMEQDCIDIHPPMAEIEMVGEVQVEGEEPPQKRLRIE